MQHLTARSSIPDVTSSVATYILIAREGAVSKTIPPGTGAALLLNIKGSYRINGMPVPDAAVVGIRDTPLQLDCDPSPTDRIFVQFTACGLSRFTSAAAHSVARRIVSAEAFFPKETLQRLLADLSGTKTFSERTALLDQFFLKFYSSPRYLEEAVRRMTQHVCLNPATSLRSLFQDIPASVRHTERLFSRLVGIDPQTFARIARFNQAKNTILAERCRSLTDIGMESGYYDQAHFIREFRRLSATRPGSYRFCLPAPLLTASPS